MMQQNSVAVQISESYLPHVVRAEIVQLESGVANLGAGPMAVRMVEGEGWITHAGQDMVVNAGQEIVLGKSRDPVVISAICHTQRIVFEINFL